MTELKNPIVLGDLNISIVDGVGNDSFNKEYENISTENTSESKLLVKDGAEYGITFVVDSKDRYAIATYVDGINVKVSDGVKLSKNVKDMESMSHHDCLIVWNGYPEQLNFLDFWFDGKGNPKLVFTKKENNIAANHLNGDIGTIKVFAWKENKNSLLLSRGVRTRGGTGVGEDSGRELKEADAITNPQYVGCATFNYEVREHGVFIEYGGLNQFDKIPRI